MLIFICEYCTPSSATSHHLDVASELLSTNPCDGMTRSCIPPVQRLIRVFLPAHTVAESLRGNKALLRVSLPVKPCRRDAKKFQTVHQTLVGDDADGSFSCGQGHPPAIARKNTSGQLGRQDVC